MRKPISKGLRFDVLNRDRFRCVYCGASAEFTTLHIDHRTPVALGGTNDLDNLVAACVDCNLGKRTKLAEIDQRLDLDGVDCPFADGWPNDIHDPVYYLNKVWAVTSFGMERLQSFYFVAASDLGISLPEDPKMSMWLDHLCTKKWAYKDFDQTVIAFMRALEAHSVIPSFDLQYSIGLARTSAEEMRILHKQQHTLMRGGAIWDDGEDGDAA